MKTVSNAYLFFFAFGSHHAYMGKWFKQILFWVTLGGFGLWALIDLISLGAKVKQHNIEEELKTIRASALKKD